MEGAAARRTEFIGGRPPTADQLESWVGWRVDDVDGAMIGRVEGIALGTRREPQWLIVSEYRLGEGRRFLIPVADACGGGGRVWSPYRRERIRLSARISGPRITPQAERRLRAHYSQEPRAA